MCKIHVYTRQADDIVRELFLEQTTRNSDGFKTITI